MHMHIDISIYTNVIFTTCVLYTYVRYVHVKLLLPLSPGKSCPTCGTDVNHESPPNLGSCGEKKLAQGMKGTENYD